MGVPLDRQGVAYSGPGACDPRYASHSVSIAPAERAFGQGAIGSFRNFTVRTVGR